MPRIHEKTVGSTAAAAFRRAAGTQLVMLPSGITVRLRKPDVIALIAEDGSIPDVLSGIALGGLALPKRPEQQFKADDVRALFGLINPITRAAFVEPRIVDKDEAELADDEILLEHVQFNDKTFVLTWALGADGKTASRFPGKQASRMEPLPAVSDVPPASE